jgi:hypothetical protein
MVLALWRPSDNQLVDALRAQISQDISWDMNISKNFILFVMRIKITTLSMLESLLYIGTIVISCRTALRLPHSHRNR